jgi:archaellum biogenesis protein FlaJ (TadC family)
MIDAMAPSTAVATIAAMITPALLILGSASLVASALVRMARVVDRARYLAALVQDGSWQKAGLDSARLRSWLERHERRARYAEMSIALLYAAIVVFVATCLSIAVDRASGDLLTWLPVTLAILGTALLLIGGALMVAESRLSGNQIGEEIRQALLQLEDRP